MGEIEAHSHVTQKGTHMAGYTPTAPDGQPPRPRYSAGSDGSAPVKPLQPQDPPEIDGYRLHGRIGEGGMGTVYLSYSPGGQPVALKVIRRDHADDPGFLSRFEREVALAGRVRGHYTLPVTDSRTGGGRPWLATAYAAGIPLDRAVLEHGPLPVDTVLLLMAGIAEGMQSVHDAGIIHRDLKPSNVLLTMDGPKVLDFGIASALYGTSLTGTGQSVGTLDYMAPEQISGSEPHTQALDIFPLGLLTYFAATGRHPYGEGPPMTVAYRIMHEPPDLSGCPATLVPIVAACLETDAARRSRTHDVIAACVQASGGTALRRGALWLPAPVRAAVAAREVDAGPVDPGRAFAALPTQGPARPVPPGPPARGPYPTTTAPDGRRRRSPALAVVTAVCAVALGVATAVAVWPENTSGSPSKDARPQRPGDEGGAGEKPTASGSPDGEASPSGSPDGGGGAGQLTKVVDKQPLTLPFPSSACGVNGVDLDVPETNDDITNANELEYGDCKSQQVEMGGRNFGTGPPSRPSDHEECMAQARLEAVGDMDAEEFRNGQTFCVITDEENVAWLKFLGAQETNNLYPDLRFELTLWKREQA
ncbi:serine/threonine-protein kinase [Streptomyces sp. NPDC058665]|uniref:serine/threonine-protein kinase n=1 Tax=Streptomyces sp. NPDC058665 TaxID=3346586 RepID=UPI00364FEABB